MQTTIGGSRILTTAWPSTDAKGGGQDMKGINQQGQAVYYNVVTKHGKVRYQIQAASGQTLQGRDRQKRKSRTFAQEHQAAAWMKRNGYEICG